MYKKVIKFEDYNGNQREMTAYFNLSKAEMMEMELSTKAGIEEWLRILIATNDHATIVQTYKNLILKSYGIKSEDGTRFIKTDKLREEFEQSAAYSEFFMELLADPSEQTRFMQNVMSGSNLPNVDVNEGIDKLKELGYDTTAIEAAMAEKSDKVVSIEKEETKNV